ncbi:MAG: hypothetical protein IT292_11285 [Deltaproteobacteria bacterium]|nr:hypothetical protein [Deltaproteobacteria bacterium]
MMKTKLIPSLADIFACLSLLSIMLTGASFMGDPGIYWHLKTGKWILENAAIPRIDPFLASASPRAWIADQWLSDVIFYQLFDCGGFALLTLASAVCLLLTYYYLAISHARSATQSLAITICSTLFLLITSLIQWFCRPVIFSFFLLSLVYLLLRRSLGNSDKPLAFWPLGTLPFIFLLWANLHPAFPLGLFVYLVFAFFYYWQNRTLKTALSLLALTLGILVATLLTPHGLGLYQQIFTLVGDSYFTSLNDEWLSPNFQYFCYKFFLASIIIFLLCGWQHPAQKAQKAELLLTAVFGYLSFLHVRYIPFYSIIVLPVFCAAVDGRIKAWNKIQLLKNVFAIPLWQSGTLLYFSLTIVIVCFFIKSDIAISELHRKESSSYPIKAVDVLEKTANDGSIIGAHPNWGGYITWRLWPKSRATIDDRNTLNTKNDYESFFALYYLKKDMKQIWSRTRYDYVLLDSNAPLAGYLRNQIAWSVLYEDDKSVLFQAVK